MTELEKLAEIKKIYEQRLGREVEIVVFDSGRYGMKCKAERGFTIDELLKILNIDLATFPSKTEPDQKRGFKFL